MVDAQAVHIAARQQFAEQTVGGLEHLRVVHAQCRQIVDVEKTAIVDLVRRHAPESQTVSLCLQQFVHQVETLRAR